MTIGPTTLARVATTTTTTTTRDTERRRWARSMTPAKFATTTTTTRARVRARAAFDAQHVTDLANAFDAVNLDLTLSDAEEALGKAAFASLSVASTIFAGKVRRRETTVLTWECFGCHGLRVTALTSAHVSLSEMQNERRR